MGSRGHGSSHPLWATTFPLGSSLVTWSLWLKMIRFSDGRPGALLAVTCSLQRKGGARGTEGVGRREGGGGAKRRPKEQRKEGK